LHFRVTSRSLAFALAVGLCMAVLGQAGVAAAKTAEPPFEVVFPQEPSVTTFTSSFGAPRSGGRRHHGNDLLAPRLTEVYAIADGVVTYVGINHLSGRNVKIQHEGGWTSHYLHLNNDNPGTDDGDAPWTLTVAPGIEEGMHVSAGQLIAWVGDSGNAEGTTPHTHFELRIDGGPIDPYSILVDAQERAVEQEAWLETRLANNSHAYEIQ
jgi:murein DD-endopeptidase MepM/ murein hydrolase activator NlpD